MVTRSLESAQEKIEGVNFDSRKHVLGFDDVLNHQRAAIYARRKAVLAGDYASLLSTARGHLENMGAEADILAKKEEELGQGAFEAKLRRLLLQAYDLFWIEHLETMDYLRGSVNLRSYGGRDPFIEYRREGLKLFKNLEQSLSAFVADTIPRIGAAPRGAAPLIHLASLPKGIAKIGRNDRVTITNGTETKEMKFKKAEPLLAQGWKLVH